jgi:hypothetical protein
MLLVHGRTDLAAPFYGIGVFLPIMIMGLAIRQHMLQNFTGLGPRLGCRDRPFRGHPVGIGLHRPDHRQVGRRRLDPIDPSQHCSFRRTWSSSPRSATATPNRSTASCVIKRAYHAVPWPPSSNGSPSRCRNTATACWWPSPVSGSSLGSTARCATTRLSVGKAG